MKRRKWDAKTKTTIVLEGLKGKPVATLRAEYEISQAQYYQWRNQFLANVPKGFDVPQQAQRGYYGAPHDSVTIPYSPVIFTVILFVKARSLFATASVCPMMLCRLLKRCSLSAKGTRMDSVEAVLAGCIV